MVDLCTQRSGQRGNGCDTPNASEGLPTPVASPPRPPTPPAAQVRQYSWHHYDKKKGDLYDVRREFVGANRQTNRVIPSLPSQAAPFSRAHLMSVVRKVERSERSKGKLQKGSVFKGLHESQGKNITSSLHSCQKPERKSQQYSVIRDNAERSNSEMNQLVHASHYAYDKNTLKSSKARKEKEEVKFKHSGSTNYDDIECDVIVHDNDATIRDIDVNKPIARKRYAQKHSFVYKKGFIKSSVRICSQTFTKIAFILAIVISILGGLCNIKQPKRKCPIGTSPSLSPSEPHIVLCFRDSSVLSSLRESAAPIIGISEGFCSCIHKGMFLKNNKPLIKSMKVLQNMIICEENFCTNRSLSSTLKLATPYVYLDYATYELATFDKNVSAGKRLVTYIFPVTSRTSGLSEYII